MKGTSEARVAAEPDSGKYCWAGPEWKGHLKGYLKLKKDKEGRRCCLVCRCGGGKKLRDFCAQLPP